MEVFSLESFLLYGWCIKLLRRMCFTLTWLYLESINPSSTTPPQSTTSSTLSSGDVHVINLRHVSNLSITPQSQQNGITIDPSALPRINVTKVQQRIRKNVADRQKEINSRGVNVSQEAQQLFDSLRKV